MLFNETVCASYSLVPDFVMCFYWYCILPSLWYDECHKFLFVSMTCLYSNPLTYVNKLASCICALSFDNHLEMCLPNGSIFCIWNRASCLLAVRGFGVICWDISTVVKSGLTFFLVGCVSVSGCLTLVWHFDSCVECWSIWIGGCEHLDCGFPIVLVV